MPVTDTFLIIWLGLFPLTYLTHIAEEYWCGGGYSRYLLTRYSVQLSQQRFLMLQVFGAFLMVVGGVLGFVLHFPFTMLAILSAVIIGNGLVHLVRSIQDRSYTPGLTTAIALWLPLGIVSLITVWESVSTSRLVIAALVGCAANSVVELLSFSGAQTRQK